MDPTDWTTELFCAIDEMDTEGFVSFLADDVAFRFGNAPAVTGRSAVKEAVAGFFGTIAGLEHSIQNTWTEKDDVVVQGEVTYTRKDESQIAIPFMNHFGMDGDLVSSYQIYIDLAPLYTES